MLRTAERIADDLDAWRQRNERHIPTGEDEKLARLVHELRALEKGHSPRTCEDCEHYAIDQLDARQRVEQADQLRARMLRDGYPLADVPGRCMSRYANRLLPALVARSCVRRSDGLRSRSSSVYGPCFLTGCLVPTICANTLPANRTTLGGQPARRIAKGAAGRKVRTKRAY